MPGATHSQPSSTSPSQSSSKPLPPVPFAAKPGRSCLPSHSLFVAPMQTRVTGPGPPASGVQLGSASIDPSFKTPRASVTAGPESGRSFKPGSPAEPSGPSSGPKPTLALFAQAPTSATGTTSTLRKRSIMGAAFGTAVLTGQRKTQVPDRLNAPDLWPYVPDSLRDSGTE